MINMINISHIKMSLENGSRTGKTNTFFNSLINEVTCDERWS